MNIVPIPPSAQAKDRQERAAPVLEVRDLVMRFGDQLIQEHVSFSVEPETIFAIMGVSGSGKSTLLKHIIGLAQPAGGQVLFAGVDFWAGDEIVRNGLRSGCGMLFQSAALWSSMTLMQNVCLPLEQLTDLDPTKREERALEVLTWVELEKFGAYYPADLSGGMKKRAGIARAVAAKPPLLILDEPSAGLDPIGSRHLDDLILDIRKRTRAAVVFVSHELPSLFAIADGGIFLDAESKRPSAHGSPRMLRDGCGDPIVHAFLHREDPAPAKGTAVASQGASS